MSAHEVALLQRARTALEPLVKLADHPWMAPPFRRPGDEFMGQFRYTEIENARDTAALLDIAIGLHGAQ